MLSVSGILLSAGPGLGKSAVATALGLGTFDRPVRARHRLTDPIFGEMVAFTMLWPSTPQEAAVREWLEANIEGRHGVDYQMRNDRVSFVRVEDADLCYLAFA